MKILEVLENFVESPGHLVSMTLTDCQDDYAAKISSAMFLSVPYDQVPKWFSIFSISSPYGNQIGVFETLSLSLQVLILAGLP